MTDHVYKIIGITGTSTQSMEDAVNKAVLKADASLNNIRWFEVKHPRRRRRWQGQILAAHHQARLHPER